jgi:hypothetical protein
MLCGCILLCALGVDVAQARGDGQECETTVDDVVTYATCFGLPEHILLSDSVNYKIASTPHNLTCGVLGPTTAYTLVGYVLIGPHFAQQ